MKIRFLVPIVALVLPSCGGMFKPVEDASVNYILDPVVPHKVPRSSRPSIAVARPSLPGYLNRQQLVSRSGDGQLQMSSFHVWSEPLDAGISRVLALNLGRLTNSLNVQPVENFVTLDYDWLLEVRISRFEMDAANQIVLECTWKLQPVAGSLATPRPFVTTVPVYGEETPAGPWKGRVGAMNEALARLSGQIARSL